MMSVRCLVLRCHSKKSLLSLPRLLRDASHLSGWDPQPWLSLEMKHKIEKVWKQHVEDFSITNKECCPNTYILSMFPYPSGKLHMGHVRVYTISDSLARFYRMQGHNVLHPMGWDAFGLPAENAAIQNGEDPRVWTEKNISVMKSQLKQLGCSFDWDRELATCDPEYYKWTQFIFLKMYEAGLIYRKASLVNWDPIDKTVLADEQIDENGNSWRSGAKAEKVMLTQWFVRCTKFSLNLLKELKTFQKEDWADIVNLQKSWIGEANGVTIDWSLDGMNHTDLSIPVWTSRPEHVCKVGFIAVKPGSMLDVLQQKKSSTKYQYTTSEGSVETFEARSLDIVACNPFTQEKIPIFVVEDMLPFPSGADTYMGVPSEVEIDSVFAVSVGLTTKSPAHECLSAESVCEKAQQMGIGGYAVSSHLKDWLISRQRYWGTPIPIIHCPACGTVPVPEDQLPVQLPAYPSKKNNATGIASPLAHVEDWVNTACPKCGGCASRETDTMDTFVDSSWYYLRYLDPSNDKELVNFHKAKQFMPVSVYVGGKEHATLHLYYARIVSHFLHQLGIAPSPEPFQRLLVQGMVMGQTLQDPETGRYIDRKDVKFQGKEAISCITGQPLTVKWEKMSKSKHNGVDPAEAINSFGIDSTRLIMLADAAPFSQRNWDPEGSKGVLTWQNNLYMLVSHFLSTREKAQEGLLKTDTSSPQFIQNEKEAYDLRNMHLSTISHHYKNTHQFMMAIKAMQQLTKKLKLLPPETVAFSAQFELAVATLITTLAPMAPHFASELWRGFLLAPGRLSNNKLDIIWEKPVLEQPWPSLDEKFELPLSIELNHKKVCSASLPFEKFKTMKDKDFVEVALQQEKVKEIIGDREFTIRQISSLAYRGAQVILTVPGLKIKEEDTMLPITKKGRLMASKKKKEAVSSQK